MISISFYCIALFSGSFFSTHEKCLSSCLALVPPHQASVFTRRSSQEHRLQTSGQRAFCPPKVLMTCVFTPLLTDTAPSVAQRVKHLPAMRETWVRSLGREVPLQKDMATHSSILAWRIPWMEEPGRLESMGLQESDTTEQFHFTSLH